MPSLLIATFGLALLGQASMALAAAPQRACAAPLNDLADEWDAIGFLPPAKPAQAIVSGSFGYQAGKDGAALARIEQVQRLLSESGG